MYGLFAAGLLIVCGSTTCSLPDERAGTALDYETVQGFTVSQGDPLLVKYAPIFMVEGYDLSYNRVGAPSARLDKRNREDIFVDPNRPVYYTQTREFDTDRGHFTNLIYRVHFEKSTGNSNSTNGGQGKNVGLMAIVTLDTEKHPVLLNVLHTCGCFHALLPTTFTPSTALPEGWNPDALQVYGETLPGTVKYPADFDESVRPVIYLREGSHRAVDVQVASVDSVRERYTLHEGALAPVEDLSHLKLGDGETSFFFTEGKEKGLVKGAIKAKETLLLGIVVGDSRVGQDRMYGSVEDVPRGFYTTITPGQQDESGMWDYKSFLEFNGWKL